MLPYLIAGAIGFGIGKLFENGGETFMAGGRITTNEDILNSFLTSTKEVKVNNLSTHFNEYDDFLLLRNYYTLIATRKGNDVKITNVKHSKTTSAITNRLKALAEGMGYNVSYVSEFENGGETFMAGGIGESDDKYGGQRNKIVTELKSMKGGLNNKAPYVFLKEGYIYVSAENGDNYADYYEYTIDEKLEDLADRYNTYWDWETAGSIVLAPIDTYAGGGGVEYRIGGEVDKELTIEQTRKIAQETANILGTEFSVTKNSVDVASFDLDLNGEEFEGGSYLIMKNGDVLNVALPNNPVYYNYKERSKNPKMIRTIFEEEYFENFDNGGGTFMAGGKADSGVGEYKMYKLRAEGLNDFINFLGTGIYFNVKSFTVEPIGVPDVVVSFESNLSLSELKSKLRKVQDSHVMLDTIKPIEEYTGERYAGGGVAKKRRRSASAQYGRSDRSFDKQLTAKPVGYRFSNAKANQLRKDPYAKPTEAQVKKYLGKGIYKENRRNRSDRDRNAKL